MPSNEQPSGPKVQFVDSLRSSLENHEFVRLTLTGYRGEEQQLNSLRLQLVRLKAGLRLAFTYRYKTKEIVKNLEMTAGINQVETLLGVNFVNARLFTTVQDVQLNYNKRLKPRLVVSKPTFPGAVEALPQGNDRQKQRYIEPANNIYLQALGISNAQGHILRTREAKFKQINKFIEIVESLYQASDLAQRDSITILDMGSGKGYLTFALYDFLNNVLDQSAVVTGIEARPELVDFCNQTAAQAQFDQLKFESGTIQSMVKRPMDMAIALHACDTATDDVIFTSIQANASIIVLAPCCHKQIRRELNQSAEVKAIWEFGILLERQAQLVTDRLRSLFLALHGYQTKVFEFISSEHTDKNIMITATKSAKSRNRDAILQQIQQIKQLYGIRSYYLEDLLAAHARLQPNLEQLIKPSATDNSGDLGG
ncbi:SAM-dependent methyltransferase [filamentous cyanobacterium LEGE 11480]|uniref:SAM-dependent methyltransferase n=1 Tax=Romeriopsis navalis LEGE 11480 TaxID=2777977 RepID=A0A928Z1X7_9CYAN|nr:SAM-dependent methyltransferase [Romeriopsis navalis]MBE9029806.1 SAM-dependent methyltransferase [Romeriopsis navalis LEGE 11480]